MPGDRVRLHNGELELVLSPSVGGSIASFDWLGEDRRRTPLMRGCHSGSINVLEAASFPLVPFVNRIRRSRFTFRGRDVVLQPNMTGDPSVLHGQGWLSPWTLLFAADGEAELAFEHPADSWPWAYEARQHFTLDGSGLSVRLSCLNASAEPMPCGLGQHPYFPCGPATRLDTNVTHVWEIDEHVLPTRKVAATGRFDLRDRMACGQGLDHGFGGWGGSVRINDPGWPVELTMSSPDARFFQLYSPAAGGLFVAEPVSHANAALNEPEDRWPELGLRVLDPGEEMRFEMRIEVRPVRPNPA
jgi:aldose 1-epimerase